MSFSNEKSAELVSNEFCGQKSLADSSNPIYIRFGPIQNYSTAGIRVRDIVRVELFTFHLSTILFLFFDYSYLHISFKV